MESEESAERECGLRHRIKTTPDIQSLFRRWPSWGRSGQNVTIHHILRKQNRLLQLLKACRGLLPLFDAMTSTSSSVLAQPTVPPNHATKYYVQLVFLLLPFIAFYVFLRKPARRHAILHRRSVAVLVLGDIGRSPRMMYHSQSFAQNDFETFVIGYSGE